ncbi:hypothetical protein LOD99_13842 [Oopsacas minuta]|uniref:Uncharacterized protein n=1 Tax=Oopsacas minuta TaxID=111878 RepID=A0AAV7KK17_9METZ|nr:hypothetical protein LOD99_13842 [Oopsacas minuta]
MSLTRCINKKRTDDVLCFLNIDRNTLVTSSIIELRKIAREKSRSLPYKTAIDMESILSRERRRLKKLEYAENDKDKYNCLITDYGTEIEILQTTRNSLLAEKRSLREEIEKYEKFFTLSNC